MRSGRALARLVALGIWTGGCVAIWLLVGFLFRVVAPKRAVSWRQWAVQRWARGVARLIGMRHRRQGEPPSPPFFLATNHLSYLDIILLQCHVRGVFIAKSEMRSWPVLGLLARLTGTIWVNRAVRSDAVRALDSIGASIAQGDGVMLFPEGTTSAGSGLLPMKASLLEWAVQERFPVHYAAVGYRLEEERSGASARDTICWWGNVGFGRHAWGVLQLRRFEASVSFGAGPVRGENRSELLERLREGIAGLFVPIPSPDRS